MTSETLASRVAVVTGGNHGIGAATACALAARGARVLVSYLRLQDPADAAIRQTYRVNRAQDALHVVEAIRATGGDAEALEADLRDPAAAVRLFDAAEAAFGPVEILVNNATGCARDTFGPGGTDQHGRTLERLTVQSATQPLEVDGRASALMIAEFARRHIARGAAWGRIIGLHPADRWVSRGSLLWRCESRPGQLRDVRGAGARAIRHYVQRGVPAGDRHRLGVLAQREFSGYRALRLRPATPGDW